MFKLRQNIFANNARFLILSGIVLVIFLSTLPYFNLILSGQIILLFFLIVLASILKFSFRYIFLVAFVFIIFSLLLLLFSQVSIAERLGNYAYFLLLLGFVQSLLEYVKGAKNKNG